MSAPKRMLLKHLRYNSWLHSFLSPRVHIYFTSEKPFREMGAFQNDSAWTRPDADAAHMRKASGVIQMRQTRQMQINKDACIRNWTDEFPSRNTLSKEFLALSGLRRMVHLNQKVGGAWTKELVRETEGLGTKYSWDRKSSWNEIMFSHIHNGREMYRTTIDMFHWTHPKKHRRSTQRKAREYRTRTFQNGSRIENAARKERRANRDRELLRMSHE